MPNYEVDYSYSVRERASMVMPANNIEAAKEAVLTEVQEMYPDARDVEIDSVGEVIED